MAYSLKAVAEAGIPIGTIVAYYGTNPPTGWLICDGRSCTGTELAKKLGISNVPDLRGRFIRMIGGNAAGMAVAQDMMIQSHKHDIKTRRHAGADAWISSSYSGSASITYSTELSGGVETRPVNMAFNYIIKANYS